MSWKKRLLAVLFFSAILVFSILAARPPDSGGSFVLPSSLQIIEESAFEGVGASEIVLPDSVKTIGMRAFFDLRALRAIYIPASTEYIGPDAVQATQSLIVYTVPGSYAEAWAEEQQIPVRYRNIWAVTELEQQQGKTMPLCTALLLVGLLALLRESAPRRYRGNELVTCPRAIPQMCAIDYVFP